MKKFLKSFYYAIKGIYLGYPNQRNIKIQTIMGLLTIIWAYIVKVSYLEFSIILILCFLVIILELVNTAFERLVDILSPEYNKKYGEIKDIAAGVVLLSSILSFIIGIILLWKPTIKILYEWSK